MTASDYADPATYVKHDAGLGGIFADVLAPGTEDPSLWRDAQGNWHAILHTMFACVIAMVVARAAFRSGSGRRTRHSFCDSRWFMKRDSPSSVFRLSLRSGVMPSGFQVRLGRARVHGRPGGCRWLDVLGEQVRLFFSHPASRYDTTPFSLSASSL